MSWNESLLTVLVATVRSMKQNADIHRDKGNDAKKEWTEKQKEQIPMYFIRMTRKSQSKAIASASFPFLTLL